MKCKVENCNNELPLLSYFRIRPQLVLDEPKINGVCSRCEELILRITNAVINHPMHLENNTTEYIPYTIVSEAGDILQILSRVPELTDHHPPKAFSNRNCFPKLTFNLACLASDPTALYHAAGGSFNILECFPGMTEGPFKEINPNG